MGPTACGRKFFPSPRSKIPEVSDGRWLDPEEQRVWRAFLRVQSRLNAQLDAELVAGNGLNLGDYEVLVHLSEAPGRSLRMAELASRLLLSPSGLTRRIDGLVRDGLVARQACPSDGRGSFAVLTDAGFERLSVAAVTHVEGVRRYRHRSPRGPRPRQLGRRAGGDRGGDRPCPGQRHRGLYRCRCRRRAFSAPRSR